MAREMKNSGIKWIGDITNTWKLEKIKYSLKERIEKNVPIKSKQILSLTAKQGVVLYENKIGAGNKPKEDFTAYKIARPNDIVMNSMNILSGSVGLSSYFGCVSPVYYMLYSEGEYDIRYFYYIFKTNVFQKSLFGLGNGILIKESEKGTFNTIRMRIPMDKFGNLFIPIASVKEQQNIANYLDNKCSEIDNLTADIEKQISLLEDYKKSIITEAVTKGLNPNVEMKNSGIEWIGKIPKHWIISKIKHIAKINPKCDIRKLNLDSVVTYSPMECIRNNVFENRPINYEELPPSLTRFQEGDLVMAKVSPCFENGNISIMKDLYSGVGFGSSELFVFRSNPITTRYLCYFLQNTNCKNYEILSFSGIAGLQRINSDHLRNTNITIPNINEQKQIADYLDKKCSEIDSLISEKKKQLEKLSSYKQSMIYEYVTGKKEVPTQEIA